MQGVRALSGLPAFMHGICCRGERLGCLRARCANSVSVHMLSHVCWKQEKRLQTRW